MSKWQPRKITIRAWPVRLLSSMSRLEVTAFLLLVVALLIGGAGNSYPILGAIIQVLSLILIAHLSVAGRLLIVPHGAILPCAISFLAILLPLTQLIPIPPAIWLGLPGHVLPAHILAATGAPVGSRSLSLDPTLTEMTALELLPGIALFWATLQLGGDARTRLLSVAVAVAALSALLGAIQKTGSNGSEMVLYSMAHAENASGLFVNRNHEACFLLAAMPLLAAVIRCSPASRRLGGIGQSVVFLTLLGLLGAGSIATTSRMGLLLLLPATCAALAIWYDAKGRRAFAIGVLFVAAVAAGLASHSSAFGVVITRFGVDEDNRPLFWSATREAVLSFWPTGSGIGTFPHVYPTVEHLDTIALNFPYNAHSDYLELLLEGGAPALLLMVAGAVFLIVSLVRLLRRDRSAHRSVGLGAWCALVLILLHSIVDYPLRMMSIMGLFGLLAGTVSRAAIPAAVDETATGVEGSGAAERRRSAILASAIIFPCALSGLFHIVTFAWAESAFSAKDFSRAVTLAPRWSDASATLAQEDLRERKLTAAHAFALRAVDSSPLDPQGPTALVLIDQALGKNQAAERILAALPSLGWRHAPAQYLLAFRASDKGDLASAIPRADALLRQGLYKAQFYPFLRAATAYPDGLSALARQLSFSPNWREDFMRNLADLDPRDFSGHEALLGMLRRGASRDTQAEADAYLERVAHVKSFLAAAAASDRLLGTPFDGNRIHDGSFHRLIDQSETASPFDWQRIAGANVTLDPSPDGLRITTNGATADMILRQVLTAPPGPYRLTWQSTPRGDAAGNPLHWALRCLDGTYLLPEQESTPNAAARLSFVVPQECQTQQIELMIDHRSIEPLDITISKINLVSK